MARPKTISRDYVAEVKQEIAEEKNRNKRVVTQKRVINIVIALIALLVLAGTFYLGVQYGEASY